MIKSLLRNGTKILCQMGECPKIREAPCSHLEAILRIATHIQTFSSEKNLIAIDYCKNKLKFSIDKALWLRIVIGKFGLRFKHETFRKV